MTKTKAATIAAWVVVCAFLLTWTAAPTQAKAYTEITKENVPLPFDSWYVPCANDGDGEVVALSGYLESTTKLTIDNKGVMHLVFQLNPKVTAEGETTGAIYNATGHSHQTVKVETDGAFSYTYTDNFALIGKGDAGKLHIKTTQRVLVDADGVPTFVVDKWEVTRCQ